MTRGSGPVISERWVDCAGADPYGSSKHVNQPGMLYNFGMTRKNVPYDLFRRLTPDGECFIYTGMKNNKGYGVMSWQGKLSMTHRLAWYFANGPIPPGAYILHSCDRPACCNPRHLRPGTNRENIDDMLARGRSHHGEKHYRAKLSAQDVREIRSVRGWNHRQLAALYGVKWRAIQKIVKGERWQR